MLKILMEELVSSKIVDENSFIGCSEEEMEEIEQIEKVFGFHLPKLYKDFLRLMGKRANDLFPDENMLFPQILSFSEEAREILEDYQPHLLEQLPKEAFVFSVYQGEQFSFFITSEGDDPPIYHFMADKRHFTKVCEKLSDFFRRAREDAEFRPLLLRINKVDLFFSDKSKKQELLGIITQVREILSSGKLPERWQNIYLNIETVASRQLK